MNADRHELVPGGADDGVIRGGMYGADADFKVFVPLVGEAKAGGSVCLALKNITNEIGWFVSKLYGLKFGLGGQERGKVCGGPVIDDQNAFRICVCQEIIGNARAEQPKGACGGLKPLGPEIQDKAAAQERSERNCELLPRAWCRLHDREEATERPAVRQAVIPLSEEEVEGSSLGVERRAPVLVGV